MNSGRMRRNRAMLIWGIILLVAALLVAEGLPGLSASLGSSDANLKRTVQIAGIVIVPVLSIAGMFLAIIGGILLVRARAGRHNESTEESRSTTGIGSLEAELQKLTDMRSRNVIDDAEYRRLRENLINHR